MNQAEPILQVANITKTFGGIHALDTVNMEVYSGKVNVIVGENGAGKSTLMKILSGVYTDYEGTVYYQGEQVHFAHPIEAISKGIAIIHQELNLIPYLTVTENIFLGRELRNRFGLLNYRRMNQKAREILQKLECQIEPTMLVADLRVGEQQLVEIAKALLEDARVLIMDEPTSAISDAEVSVLFKIIRRLREQQVAILYISHKLDELVQIADRYIGLRDGKLAGTIEDAAKADKDTLIRLMVGRNLQNVFDKDHALPGKELLRVENLSVPHRERKDKFMIRNISFKLRQGEVLGVFGLMGAGRTELLESLFGLHSKNRTGQVFIDGAEVAISTVAQAISHGMALVPEDRKEDGLVLGMEVYKNISLAQLNVQSESLWLNHHKEIELAQTFIGDLGIKTASPKLAVGNLSGGNQQKVVLAKWLAIHPRILFLDEPTRGIDVGAKNEIYRLIDGLAKQGLGVMVVSSELPEILAISDRILVMSDTRLTAELSRSEANEEKIMKAAIA